MPKLYDKDDNWSLRNIGIRMISYPFCLMAIMMALHSLYLSIFEAENPAELVGGVIITTFFTVLISVFLYFDIRNILGKDKEEEKIGRRDILDDEL